MVTPELIEFLRSQHSAGMGIEEIEHLLISEGGWNQSDIDEAFQQFGINPQLSNMASRPLAQVVVEDQAGGGVPSDVVGTPAVAGAPGESPVSHPQVERVEEPAVAVVLESLQENVQNELPVSSPLGMVSSSGETAPAASVVDPRVLRDPSLEEEVTDDVQFIFDNAEVATLSPDREMQMLKEVSPDDVDDFLGLFAEHQNVPAPLQGQVLGTDDPVGILVQTTEVPVTEPPPAKPLEQPVPSPAVAKPIPAGVSYISEIISEKNPGPKEVTIPPATVPSVVAEKIPETPAQVVLPENTISPAPGIVPVPSSPETASTPAPKEEPRGVQFDLSKVVTPSEQAPKPNPPVPAPNPSPDGLEKSIETKSVSDVWKAGKPLEVMKPSVNDPSVVRKTLRSKRTMSSDLIRGGKGVPTPAMPALSTENLPTPVELPRVERAVTPPSPVVVQRVGREPKLAPTLAEELRRKNTIKRVISIALGVLVVFLLVAGAFAFYMANRGLTPAEKLSSALTQFAGIGSFSYVGDGSTNLVLSAPASGEGDAQNGNIKFNFHYSGSLKNSTGGYGDGAHRFKVSGGFRSGTYEWNTDVESDVRVIGDALFFHLLSYPALTELDPEVTNTYWVKVDLATLMKELSLTQENSGKKEYGTFGSSNNDLTFNALVNSNQPFLIDGTLPDEQIAGVQAIHVKLKSDKEKMYALAIPLYKKYFGKDLVLSDAQRLRLKDALGKISGEAWLDPDTNQFLKLSVRGDFDDDIVSAHVKGTAQLVFEFSDSGKAVTVSEPTPFLTLEEYRARTEQYKKNKELRVSDGVKLEQLQHVISALSAYHTDKGRYPATIFELRSSGKLSASVIDDFAMKQFSYLSYLTPDNRKSDGRCTAKGKICTFFHLGVNLEDLTNPVLDTDADATSELNGKDSSGCGGEMNLACFDVVSTALSTMTISTGTAK